MIMFSKRVDNTFWQQVKELKNRPNNPFMFYKTFFDIRNNQTTRIKFFSKLGIQVLWRLFVDSDLLHGYINKIRQTYGEE